MPSLAVELPADPQPIDFYKLLFKDDMWTLLMEQTNLYADTHIATENLKPNSRLQKWRLVSRNEMKVFVSLVIAMGLTRKGDIDAYWSQDFTIHT